jgi:hypothetical protein
MYCKGIVHDVCKEKKKKYIYIYIYIYVIYSYFLTARFIVSEVVMTRNYPNIITYAFL